MLYRVPSQVVKQMDKALKYAIKARYHKSAGNEFRASWNSEKLNNAVAKLPLSAIYGFPERIDNAVKSESNATDQDWTRRELTLTYSLILGSAIEQGVISPADVGEARMIALLKRARMID